MDSIGQNTAIYDFDEFLDFQFESSIKDDTFIDSLKCLFLIFCIFMFLNIFVFKFFFVLFFILHYFLDEMLNEKAKENKEHSTLNKNELPFKVYSYSLKPGAFMRSYNQKPQNFKFVFFCFSFKFTKLHKGRFTFGKRIRPKRCQEIYNSFKINKIYRRSIFF